MNIDEQFKDLIREKMTDNQFWVWVRDWFDSEYICEIAENWDEESKINTLKEFNIKTEKELKINLKLIDLKDKLEEMGLNDLKQELENIIKDFEVLK